ncbi:cysteine proteinase [Dendrothele bispora CBS 962.96]|uniref:Cysteine proteinase n=1 Tax=Dendrothele bispora (strain CBS 962.96) TaxID=1314807 RepID=A0A4S8LYK2_DENBC|nr:cysteine proteinase [Dendrothele bispora CBS 962.96]
MALFNLMKHSIGTEKEAQEPPKQAIFVQQSSKAGLLVTNELGKALRDCKAKVDRISRDCRMKNRKFRDLEFDLEYDSRRCLHGLGGNNEIYLPSDVQRVTEIFDSPQFFVDGVSFAYPVGGDISNSWFVSALATVARKRGLIKRLCVARDEQVGVYGFIFFKDSAWVTVIIDDLLYTCIPKFEALSPLEKQLYHDNKQFYNTHARKGTKSLYFAKSATQGETWVPLIEKAYAKLYGSYAALVGGDASEAIEDLTGGVSTFIPTRDIFDTDRFWNEELLKVNIDRLFGCTYEALSGVRSGNWSSQVHGLVGNYSYSVVRAAEVNGKRFVVVRGPASGQTGWTGPWSDGSKEWTKEWAELLPEIGHVLGEDGQFVMEYKDFLNCWDTFDKTLLFDDSWVMSSQWLHVATRPLPAWTFGNVSFTFSLSQSTHAVIVLSQIDDRSFYEISGRSSWELDFVLFKAGKKQVVTESFPNQDYARSVNVEVDLEAGDYIVHVSGF